MNTIPLHIAKYLRSTWMADTIITYLQIDKQGNLASWGGHPRHYGLSNITMGQPATEQLCFLEGLLSVPHSQKLEFVNLGGDRYAHVHIIPSPENTWILLLDATREHNQKQQMQQQVNELTLLTYRQSQLLQELETARRSLEEEKQKLEELIESKSRLITSILRETDVPPACMISYTQLVNKVEQAEVRTTDYLTSVKDNTNNLLAMIDNVLDETTLEMGQVALYTSSCDIKQLLDNLVSVFLPVARTKGLLFQVDVKDTVPTRLLLDELRFRQVLINLITNALKFTQKGFVSITFNWQWQTSILEFVVADSGPGISKETQHKIFGSPSSNGGTSPAPLNSKLGLSISRHFAKLMGGELSVESSPQMGSIFSGFIQAPASYTHSLKTDQETSAILNTTILIVVDSPDVRVLMGIYLEDGGYTVITADNGIEATSLALQHQPDLILMDMQMPGLTGYEVVKQLRFQHFRQPIVALSASSLSQDHQYALEVGCNHCLTKPVSPEILLSTVKQFLK